MERGSMKDKQMNIHRSLNQSWITSKEDRKLRLGIERTHSLKNNSKAYFLGKQIQRGTWPANSKGNSRMDRITFTPDPRLLLVPLPNIRINCRIQGCAMSASRDNSHSVAKIICIGCGICHPKPGFCSTLYWCDHSTAAEPFIYLIIKL